MLTVHHLGVSQSERIVWICEELGLDYTLQIHKRDPVFSPQSIKDLHSLGAAPIIQDGDVTLAESGACADYINSKHGEGKLALPPSHPRYADYLYWFHFANGTLQPALGRLMVLQFAKVDRDNEFVKRMHEKMAQYLRHVDQRLGDEKNIWLAGEDFTAADCMNVFTLTTMRVFYGLDLSGYDNVLAWLKRCCDRPAYVRAREKGDPGLELMIDGPPPKSYFDRLA